MFNTLSNIDSATRKAAWKASVAPAALLTLAAVTGSIVKGIILPVAQECASRVGDVSPHIGQTLQLGIPFLKFDVAAEMISCSGQSLMWAITGVLSAVTAVSALWGAAKILTMPSRIYMKTVQADFDRLVTAFEDVRHDANTRDTTAAGIAHLMVQHAQAAREVLSSKYSKSDAQALYIVRQKLDGSIAKSGNPFVIEILNRAVLAVRPDLVTKGMQHAIARSDRTGQPAFAG